MQNTESSPFVRVSELERMLGVSKDTIFRWEKAGKFPRKIKIGPRFVAWRRSVIERWIADPEGTLRLKQERAE